jgi:hypothetical protein
VQARTRYGLAVNFKGRQSARPEVPDKLLALADEAIE